MLILLIACIVAAVVSLLIVRATKVLARHSLDDDFEKPQGFHAVAAPRIGGLGIVLGLVAAASVLRFLMGAAADLMLLLLVCAMPAFLAGFVQDFTERVTPRGRLLATLVAAMLAYALLGAGIRHTTIPGLDWLVLFPMGSLALTLFAVAGIANAVNIIDGFNGLASMCVIIMLSAVAYVGFQVGDPLIGSMALACIGAVLGFFLWNFPAGLIFLGDGGAYFLGFYVSELCVLLLNRNPGEVSPLFPLLVCIYPVFETVFSIYRRTFLRAVPSSMPDGIHLHSLIYRRVMRWAVGSNSAQSLTRRNSLTSPYLWVLCMFSVAPATLFWDNTVVLAGFLVLFAASYIALYWRIVRFRSPSWMHLSGWRAPPPPPGDNSTT